MKIAVCGDIHVSRTSSIIRSTGQKFSIRLENCIKSIEWFEKTAEQNGCDCEIFLGDFFDKSTLIDEEITAVSTIKWNKLKKYIIIGNHESSVADLRFSAVRLLQPNNFSIISVPTILEEEKIAFLPYCIESERKEIFKTLGCENKLQVIFSHNDLKNINYGLIKSTSGYDLDDIKKSTNLFVNGHIHNYNIIDNVINLGNLTGQNFGEDALRYSHKILILDTETLQTTFIENPNSFNFYKFNINTKKDVNKILKIKDNAVLSISSKASLMLDCKEALDKVSSKIVEKRITVVGNSLPKSDISELNIRGIDHIEKLTLFCKENLENTSTLLAELDEISRQ